jgi:hypothetical protein
MLRFRFVLTLLLVCAICRAEAAAPSRYRPGRLLLQPARGDVAQELARFHVAHGARLLRHFPKIEGVQVLEVAPPAFIGSSRNEPTCSIQEMSQ